MMQHLDYPFYDVAREAEAWMKKGHIIHQKFTCAGCGIRQTMAVPNIFYETGQCEECGHITNIVKRGCNYMLVTARETAH